MRCAPERRRAAENAVHEAARRLNAALDGRLDLEEAVWNAHSVLTKTVVDLCRNGGLPSDVAA